MFFVKSNSIPYEFHDGFAQTELFEGSHAAVHLFKCVLKAGTIFKPELYSDKYQVFAFIDGTGAVLSPSNVYAIKEESVYVPNFDKETVELHAATDLVFMRYIVDFTEIDFVAMESFRMVYPYFMNFKDCPDYTQDCKGDKTYSKMLIQPGRCGRIFMGLCETEISDAIEGTAEYGHPAVDQWNCILKGSDIRAAIKDEHFEQHFGDVSYIVAGDDHSCICMPGKLCRYFWLEWYTNPESVASRLSPQKWEDTLRDVAKIS